VSAARRSQGSSVALLERLVLATFSSSASLTRVELEELTGLSRTVVAGVVAALVARGELAELRQPPTAGARGRPPTRYQRTALLAPVLLIQLTTRGSTWVSSMRGDGASSDTHQCAAWSQAWPAWSRSVLEAAARLRDSPRLRDSAQPPPRLAVLSVPFPVAQTHGDSRGHDMAYAELRASPWLQGDPGPALSDLLGCMVLVVNEANLAALGEASFGAGRGRRGVLYISVKNGVGAGFVFDGRLFTGAHGFSGELAHVQVNPDGAACRCGNRGCLGTEEAARGMLRRPASWDGAELGPLVGRAVAPLVTVLDPDCIVVDANLAAQCDPFIAAVNAELTRRCPPGLAASLAVVPGDFTDAERYGALTAADTYAATLVSEGTWPAFPQAAGAPAWFSLSAKAHESPLIPEASLFLSLSFRTTNA
jgi:predicted NBD/HSP70 family sugar kinase